MATIGNKYKFKLHFGDFHNKLTEGKNSIFPVKKVYNSNEEFEAIKDIYPYLKEENKFKNKIPTKNKDGKQRKGLPNYISLMDIEKKKVNEKIIIYNGTLYMHKEIILNTEKNAKKEEKITYYAEEQPADTLSYCPFRLKIEKCIEEGIKGNLSIILNKAEEIQLSINSIKDYFKHHLSLLIGQEKSKIYIEITPMIESIEKIPSSLIQSTNFESYFQYKKEKPFTFLGKIKDKNQKEISEEECNGYIIEGNDSVEEDYQSDQYIKSKSKDLPMPITKEITSKKELIKFYKEEEKKSKHNQVENFKISGMINNQDKVVYSNQRKPEFSIHREFSSIKNINNLPNEEIKLLLEKIDKDFIDDK